MEVLLPADTGDRVAAVLCIPAAQAHDAIQVARHDPAPLNALWWAVYARAVAGNLAAQELCGPLLHWCNSLNPVAPAPTQPQGPTAAQSHRYGQAMLAHSVPIAVTTLVRVATTGKRDRDRVAAARLLLEHSRSLTAADLTDPRVIDAEAEPAADTVRRRLAAISTRTAT